jgi:hypothetical protein
VGGNAPHNNMQPYLGLSYIIALLAKSVPLDEDERSRASRACLNAAAVA